MRLKEIYIKEEATAGATASGNIASIANPHVTNLSRNSVAYTGKPGGPGGKGPVKQVKGGTYNTGKNALDMDVKLLSSKEPQMIRRQIQEGSLYQEGLWDWLTGGGDDKEEKLAKPKKKKPNRATVNLWRKMCKGGDEGSCQMLRDAGL